ncbi:hypothetical protein JTB14_019610 [Gonioctena quinquepunctata]|nr:hypothetical protein JTB14_019610 [Gonioctena quinquepunctata]
MTKEFPLYPAKRTFPLWKRRGQGRSSRQISRNRSPGAERCPYLIPSCISLLLVLWVQQQHEKKRRKRDFSNGPSTPAFSQFISEVAPSAADALHGQPRYRAASTVSFPDPLFREEWYLVRLPMFITCALNPSRQRVPAFLTKTRLVVH